MCKRWSYLVLPVVLLESLVGGEERSSNESLLPLEAGLAILLALDYLCLVIVLNFS